MNLIINLIKWCLMAPFKILRFIVGDLLIFGIIGGVLSLVKSILKLVFKPLTLCAILGGTLLFVVSDEERKNKVKAMIGL